MELIFNKWNPFRALSEKKNPKEGILLIEVSFRRNLYLINEILLGHLMKRRPQKGIIFKE